MVEQGRLRGRAQEWNISRTDMKVDPPCCPSDIPNAGKAADLVTSNVSASAGQQYKVLHSHLADGGHVVIYEIELYRL